MSTIFYPKNLGIELVRGCNFSCPMCPVTSNASSESQKFQFLDLALLQRLVEEIDRWPSIETIWFFHFGEPMMHPYFRECLEILHRSAVALRALVIQHTNASLLKGDKADAILDIPIVKKLVFSFDGFGDQDSFERLRGPHYEHVLANIREFSEKARHRRPDLLLATCTIFPREGEVPGLRVPPKAEALRQLEELFRPLGVAVETRDMHDYSGNDDLKISGRKPNQVLGGCVFVETDSLYFTVNGWAQPCRAVYSESFNVGRFSEQDFGGLLNNARMKHIRHALRMDERAGVPFCQNCSLSIGGAVSPKELRRFWQARDQQGLVDDLQERRYIFGTVVPTPHTVVRVDLGCGAVKQVGFIGIDLHALPRVGIVADLNQSLPLRENSVDLLYASHSLEHVVDLLALVKEIYRVCKHGAQVCIVAPYYQQGLNLANPYHKQIFNEHTPRFWTNVQTTSIPPEEFAHPHASGWGLSESDSSAPGIDLRCLKIEFFYFPEYRSLPPEEQRAARRKYLDVCDQIMFHLQVVKAPVSEDDMHQLTEKIEYYEPPFVTIRKLQEQLTRKEQAAEILQQALAMRETELTRLRVSLEEKHSQAAELEAKAEAALQQAQLRLHAREREAAELETHAQELRQTLAARESELADIQASLAEVQGEVARQKQAAQALRQVLAARERALKETETVLQGREGALQQAQLRLHAREREAAELETQAQELRQMLTVREAELTRTQAVLADTQEQVALREQAVQELQGVLAARETELVQMQTSLIETQGKAASQEQAAQELRPALAAREGELRGTKTRLSQAEQRIALWQGKAQAVAIELTSFRQRRVTRWLTRLHPGGDLRDEITPAFQQLKDDSLLFTPNLKGFRLQPSRDLQHVPFLAYPLNLRRANLTGVLLAPILDFPVSEGRLGIELVSPANTIVAQSVVPCSEINEQVPTRFVFPPIADSHQGRFWLRVFVRDVAGPVRLFEWRKYGLAGLGRLHTRAFCGFIFQ